MGARQDNPGEVILFMLFRTARFPFLVRNVLLSARGTGKCGRVGSPDLLTKSRRKAAICITARAGGTPPLSDSNPRMRKPGPADCDETGTTLVRMLAQRSFG
jgi:hypothetical protein